MSDLKTCPFCREDIPARAIKCRYCESMLDDSSIRAIEKEKPVDEEKKGKAVKKAPVRQEIYYPPGKENQGNKKSFLVPLIIVVALLMLAGAGAGYWFLWGNGAMPVAESVESSDVIGSWKGANSDAATYFQFLPNEMVNVAVPPEGYWFRTQYRVVKADTVTYLELYHRGMAEWERIAEIYFRDEDALTVVDAWNGIVIELDRIPDPEFREVINDLRFER